MSEEVVTEPIETPVPPAPEKEGEEKEEEQPKAGDRLQKRIDRMTREKYQLKGELEAERRRTQELMQARPAQSQEGKPVRSAYANDEEYIEAVTDYKLDQKIKGLHVGEQKQAAEKDFATKVNEHKKRMDTAAKSIPGFTEKVADVVEMDLPKHVIDFILDTKKSAELIAYLADNPDELEEIQDMSERRATARLGVLEEKVSVAQTKKTSKATPPINPLSGKAPATNQLHAGLSTDEWMQRRRESLKRK